MIGPDFDLRVHQAGGTDDLLHHHAGGFGQLVRPRRGRDVDHLIDAVLEFFKGERPVVERAGQPEAVIHQHLFARPVAVIHALQLRDGLVALVDENHMIVRQIIEQRGRRFSWQAPGKMARVIFDAVAVADLLDHFEIEHGALIQPLRFHELAFFFELLVPPLEFALDALERLFARLGRHHVVRFRINGQPQVGLADLAEQRIDLAERVDFIAPELDAIRVIVVGGEDLDHVAAHAESAALEVIVVALVEDLDQLREDLLARDLLALFEHQEHAVVGFGRAQTVNAADAGDDHAIAAFEQRAGGRKPELIELVVDGGFFFDVDIARGDVGFGLVVVVIADEILDRVGGEKRFEFVIELGGQRFVVRQHQRGPAGFFDHLGHGVGFSGAGDAEQDLMLFAIQNAAEELIDGCGLVAARAIIDRQMERHIFLG